jgi:hypothetical protein
VLRYDEAVEVRPVMDRTCLAGLDEVCPGNVWQMGYGTVGSDAVSWGEWRYGNKKGSFNREPFRLGYYDKLKL